VRLYWARNDGMTGHVFLGPTEIELLGREMVVQGMADSLALEELRADDVIGAGDIETALERASAEPISLHDRKLWADWLTFLRGAAANGGVVVR
jgi:hypothetical protein